MKNTLKKEKFFHIGRLKSIPNYLIIGLIVLLFLSISKNFTGASKVNQKIAEKESKAQKLKEEQERLKKQLETVQSDAYIEKQLRDKLNLAKEGEVVVVLPPEEVLRKFAPHYEEEEDTLPDPNWKKWMKLFL